jgi:hypothetical protein
MARKAFCIIDIGPNAEYQGKGQENGATSA